MDFVGRFACRLIGGRGDNGDNVAVKDHLIFDDRQVIFNDNADHRRAGNILPGRNPDYALYRQRLVEIQLFDFARWDIRIAANAVEHIRQRNIIAVYGGSFDFRQSIHASWRR